MSTTAYWGLVSGCISHNPPSRELASVNAAFSAISVAGSMPVRPKVRGIVEIHGGNLHRVLRRGGGTSTHARARPCLIGLPSCSALLPQAAVRQQNARG